MKQHFLTIKAKLIAGFAFMFVLTGSLGIFGYYGISTVASHADALYKSNTRPIIDVASVRAATLRIRLNLWRAQVERQPEAMERLAVEIEKARKELDKSWRSYYPDGISSSNERVIADAIGVQLDKFAHEADTVLKLIRAGDYEGARQHQMQELAQLADNLNQSVDAQMRDNIKQAGLNASNSHDLAEQIKLVSAGLMLIGAVVALLLPTVLVRAVTRPLAKAGDIATRVADGKLGEPVEVGVRDEVGQLIGTLKEMDSKLVSTVRGIRTSSDSVLVASGEIAMGNLDLSARTEQQAAALEQTAATMSEITETVKQNADNARQADTLAKNALNLSGDNNRAVSEMVRTMDSIAESSGKIAEITSMIEGIAFQTNILALNAAVEAARAGEQGRGFAVVAGEVRTLAQRSSMAAKQIKELIDQSSSIVHSGTSQATEVGTAMHEVVRVINMVSDIIGEIAAASEEQSRGVAQVHQAISEIDGVTQQNAALVEEISAAAQSLEEQAARMREEVMFFHLADDGGAGQSQPASTARVAGGRPRDARRALAAPAAARPAAPAVSVRKPTSASPAPRAASVASIASIPAVAGAVALAGAGAVPADADAWEAF